jgi:hypothetical protein
MQTIKIRSSDISFVKWEGQHSHMEGTHEPRGGGHI